MHSCKLQGVHCSDTRVGSEGSPGRSSCRPNSSTESNCIVATFCKTRSRQMWSLSATSGSYVPARSCAKRWPDTGCKTQTWMCACNPPRPCDSIGPKKACTAPKRPPRQPAAMPSACPAPAKDSTPNTCTRNNSNMMWKKRAWPTGSRATRRHISSALGISGLSASICHQEDPLASKSKLQMLSPLYRRFMTGFFVSATLGVVNTSGGPNRIL